MQRIYPLSHAPMNFYFKQSPDDFVVKEHNLYPFSGEGEHLILYVRKKNMTTWEMLNAFAKYLKINKKELGYAGLKDKHALTYQYISLFAKYEKQLEGFAHPNIKILSKTRHDNKLKIGHLKGNSFFIRFKKVTPLEAKKIKEVVKWIKENGSPNYFGHQRFSDQNIDKAKALIDGKLRLRDKRERTFLLNAYQSKLFNDWLAKRIEFSKLLHAMPLEYLTRHTPFSRAQLQSYQQQSQFFTLLEGDVMMHYPYGKVFELDSLQRFLERDTSPTGALFGKKVTLACKDAREFEKLFETPVPANGARRHAWIFPEIEDYTYKEESEHFELSLNLPKGCYATVVIEMIKNVELM